MKDVETAHSDPAAPTRPPDFGDYGVGILAHRLDKLLAHTTGAKTGEDTVAIHQMRVWSRRSRAALDVFAVCFAGRASAQYACMEREVKNVTRALGAARDLDVMIDTLQTRGESLPEGERGGVESFIAYLQAQRADRQEAVTQAVQRLESRHLKRALRRAARRQGYDAVTLSVPQSPAVEPGGAQDAKANVAAGAADKIPEQTGENAELDTKTDTKDSTNGAQSGAAEEGQTDNG